MRFNLYHSMIIPESIKKVGWFLLSIFIVIYALKRGLTITDDYIFYIAGYSASATLLLNCTTYTIRRSIFKYTDYLIVLIFLMPHLLDENTRAKAGVFFCVFYIVQFLIATYKNTDIDTFLIKNEKLRSTLILLLLFTLDTILQKLNETPRELLLICMISFVVFKIVNTHRSFINREISV